MVAKGELDAIQAEVIEDIVKSPRQRHWVKGFAGSGKTIVLTHVLERLASTRQDLTIGFVTYTHALKHMVQTGLSAKAQKQISISTLDALSRMKSKFDVIVIDETQDAQPKHLIDLLEKSKSFVIAADFDQSIYNNVCTESLLFDLMAPLQDHQLHEIYRMNENIFRIATAVHHDVQLSSKAMYRADRSKASLYKAKSIREEFVTVFEEAHRLAARGRPSAVILPTWKLIDQFIHTVARAKSYRTPHKSVVDDKQPYIPGKAIDPYGAVNQWLRNSGSSMQVLASGSGDLLDSDSKKIVYVMTYHAAKGLEFPNVFLPHLTSTTSLNAWKGGKDADERRFFFVGCTRAKERLCLSYHGAPHRFLDDIPARDLKQFKKTTGRI